MPSRTKRLMSVFQVMSLANSSREDLKELLTMMKPTRSYPSFLALPGGVDELIEKHLPLYGGEAPVVVALVEGVHQGLEGAHIGVPGEEGGDIFPEVSGCVPALRVYVLEGTALHVQHPPPILQVGLPDGKDFFLLLFVQHDQPPKASCIRAL